MISAGRARPSLHKLMLCALMISLLPIAAKAAEEPEDFCTKYKAQAANAKPRITSNSRFDGIFVDCNSKTVEYRSFTKKNFFGGSAAWETRTQNDWNRATCQNEMNIKATTQEGWQIIQKITFNNGKTVNFTASCIGI